MNLAFPEFLLAGWQDNVRAECGGVSTEDLPDATLALDSYAPSSEDRIKELIPDWADLKTGKPTEFNRATIRHMAAKACDFLQVKINQSERIGGEYQYQLQQIDWTQKKANLMSACFYYLSLIDEDAVADMPYIEVIQRDPATYQEFETEET